MRKAKLQGRIEQHAAGLGLPDEELAEQRAGEIAATEGRLPAQFTPADLDQARAELTEGSAAATREEDSGVYIPRGVPVFSRGQAVENQPLTDEQQEVQELVDEGVEEAAHNQIVEGNKESRRKDEQYEDQLTPAEPGEAG